MFKEKKDVQISKIIIITPNLLLIISLALVNCAATKTVNIFGKEEFEVQCMKRFEKSEQKRVFKIHKDCCQVLLFFSHKRIENIKQFYHYI